MIKEQSNLAKPRSRSSPPNSEPSGIINSHMTIKNLNCEGDKLKEYYIAFPDEKNEYMRYSKSVFASQSKNKFFRC